MDTMTNRPAIHTYRIVDDCTIGADIYRPDVDGTVPAVVYLHGGALIWGTRSNAPSALIERLNKHGVAVISADYRLAPEAKLADIVSDVGAVLAWIGDRGPELGIDANRVAVAGSSAGGYLALLAGTMMPGLRAIVSLYGYGDLLGDWYTRPSAHYLGQPQVTPEQAWSIVGDRPISVGDGERFLFYLYCRQRGRWVQEVSRLDPDLDERELVQYCPARVAGPDYPPALLIHGDSDTDVPDDQSRIMHSALTRLGVTSELMIMSGRGHAFDRDAEAPDVVKMFDHAAAFLLSAIGSGR